MGDDGHVRRKGATVVHLVRAGRRSRHGTASPRPESDDVERRHTHRQAARRLPPTAPLTADHDTAPSTPPKNTATNRAPRNANRPIDHRIPPRPPPTPSNGRLQGRREAVGDAVPWGPRSPRGPWPPPNLSVGAAVRPTWEDANHTTPRGATVPSGRVRRHRRAECWSRLRGGAGLAPETSWPRWTGRMAFAPLPMTRLSRRPRAPSPVPSEKARGRRGGQCIVIPPLTERVWPVM